MMHDNHPGDTTPASILVAPASPTAARPRRSRQKQKPLDWLEEPYNHARGETALWVAVITQAMMDGLSRSGSSEARYHKHEAIRWLTGNSRDFTMVCLCAGLDPDYVRRKAKRALVAPRAWRAEPGRGKRYLERKAYRKKIRETLQGEPAYPGGNVIRGPWIQS